MIDWSKESMLSLHGAAKILPARRGGAKPSYTTVWRWATSGQDGILLESLVVGETLCTSKEALQRFFEALTKKRFAAETAKQSKKAK